MGSHDSWPTTLSLSSTTSLKDNKLQLPPQTSPPGNEVSAMKNYRTIIVALVAFLKLTLYSPTALCTLPPTPDMKLY
jgi:hypothetical protein